MPNVVRFTLSTARDLNVPGAGFFHAGVLDIDANDLKLLARTRYLVDPYGAVEVGIVDSATPKPALPAVPAAPPADPYPQYVTDADIANPASSPMVALRAVFAGARDAVTAPSTAAQVNNNPNVPLVRFMDSANRLVRASSAVVQRSTDNGATWTDVVTLPRAVSGIRQIDNGELVLATADDFPANTVKSALYVTSGYAGTGTVTVRKVLDADDYQQSIGVGGWGFGGAGGVYVVSEYDSKAPGSRSATQKVWLTTDSFATTSVVYDHGNGSLSSRHVHGACYDPYRDAIWVTLGDYTGSATGDRRIIVSWDRGATWTTVTSKQQPTAIVAFPDCVIFGNDNAPNGVIRIDRPSPTNLRVEVAYKVSNYIDTVTNLPALSHVAEAPFRATFPGAPALIPFSVATSGQYGMVLSTTDGYSFEEVWRSPTSYGTAGYGPKSAIGPTPDGKIIIAGQSGSTFWRAEVPAPVPGLTSTIAEAVRSVARSIPRRSYIALANQSSPAFQQMIGSGAANELLLSTGTPTYVDDPSDLFTPSPDGLGVIVNRHALVRVEVDSGMDQQFTAPRVSIAVNGAGQTGTSGRIVSRTMWVRAGQRISGIGTHGGAGNTTAAYGTSYGLTLDAWGTY